MLPRLPKIVLNVVCILCNPSEIALNVVGILCKHAHKVFTCCNIIILPSQYISNRWTKYAKQEIFTSKLNCNDSLESMFAHTSRKIISLALKCKTSKEVLFFSKREKPRPLHQNDAYGPLINKIK